MSLFPLFMHEKKLGCKIFDSNTFLLKILEILFHYLLDLKVAEKFEISLILLFHLYTEASSSWRTVRLFLYPAVYFQCRPLSWNMVKFFFKKVILYSKISFLFLYATCYILINMSGLCFLSSVSTIFSLKF